MNRREKMPRKERDMPIQRLNNAGVAMLMVLIVSAVVMVFCLSLLLVTYSLFTQTSRQTTGMQCRLLAQSSAESIREELKDPSSELSVYLKSQIQSGNWVPEDALEEAEGDLPQNGTFERLRFHLNMGDKTPDYRVTVVMTYSLNATDEESGGDEGGDDNDDQDHTLTHDSVSGGNAREYRSYSLKAVIRCTRGETTDRDSQYYEIETGIPAITF